MQSRLGITFLACSWLVGLLPAATVNFESRAIQSTILDVVPAAAALLLVTSVLVGLCLYLRRSASVAILAAVAAIVQVMPVLGISAQNPKLIADFAQLSGVDVANSAIPLGSVDVLFTPWLFFSVSLALAFALALIAANRLAKGSESAMPGAKRPVEAQSVKSSDYETDLWQSQLLESRVNKKDKNAR